MYMYMYVYVYTYNIYIYIHIYIYIYIYISTHIGCGPRGPGAARGARGRGHTNIILWSVSIISIFEFSI